MLQTDKELLLLVNGQHTGYWDTFMWLCSGRVEWLALYAALLYVLWRNYGWRTLLWMLLAIGVMLLLTDTLLSQVIRPAIGRMRPSNPHNALSSMVHIVDNYRGGRFGFPSSHASNAWGLVMFVSCVLRRRLLIWFLALWALLLCYSRMYLGVHYPGDLAGGMVYGLLCSFLVYRLLVRVIHFRPVEQPMLCWLPVLVGMTSLLVFLVSSIFIKV